MRANRSVPLLMLFVLAGSLAPILATAQMPAVLPLRERGPIYDRWLKDRLNTVLPEIMRRQGIDMWLVICREYEEDPVYLSLVPLDSFSARRLSMLVFYDRGKDGIEKFRAHGEILQVRSEAYSSWSKKNVNDSDHAASAD